MPGRAMTDIDQASMPPGNTPAASADALESIKTVSDVTAPLTGRDD